MENEKSKNVNLSAVNFDFKKLKITNKLIDKQKFKSSSFTIYILIIINLWRFQSQQFSVRLKSKAENPNLLSVFISSYIRYHIF